MSSDNSGKISIDNEWKIQYYRNHRLGRGDEKFKRAIIVIHGAKRNAATYYSRTLSAVNAEQLQESTLLIASNFKTREDSPDSNELYWSQQGWKIGENAENGGHKSSFTVIDTILGKIAECFPNIALITIAGHSAGGQFVQRYAGLNSKEKDLHLRVRYVAANPSSYMYLTSERPYDTSNCPEYNNYKYGMADLPSVLPYTSLATKQIKTQLLARKVCLLLGVNDTQTGGWLDETCPATAQGPTRYKRGLAYYDHIKKADPNANHVKIEVACVGHSSNDMFNSSKGRIALLADIASVDDVLGSYTFHSPSNDWHYGEITRNGSGLQWSNRAGRHWRLTPDIQNNRLLTDSSFPYQSHFQNFDLVVEDGKVQGFISNNDLWQHNS